MSEKAAIANDSKKRGFFPWGKKKAAADDENEKHTSSSNGSEETDVALTVTKPEEDGVVSLIGLFRYATVVFNLWMILISLPDLRRKEN